MDYQNGKIYSIRCYSDDSLVYYGSTTQSLSKRLVNHRSDYKNYLIDKKNYITSFKLLELADCYIELEELCPCNTKEELLKQEGYYIRNNQCVNKKIPDRTQEEKKELRKQFNQHYRNLHKDTIEANRDFRKSYMRKYNLEHSDEAKENRKENREKNKDKLKARRQQPFMCACGRTLKLGNKAEHLKSNFHLENSNDILNE